MTTLAAGTLAAALNAAFRGWYVLPLRPGDKRPLSHDTEWCPRTGPCAAGHRTWEQRATRDPAAVEAYWSAHPAHGVGIACGPSGLVVVDLDTPKPDEGPPAPAWAAEGVRNGADVLATLARRAGAEVPRTYTVRTGRGGWHLYYTAPPGIRLANTGRTLGPWVDTRAWGGQVVAAGSTVAGRPYTLARDVALAPLPPGCSSRSDRPRRPRSAPSGSPWAPGGGPPTSPPPWPGKPTASPALQKEKGTGLFTSRPRRWASLRRAARCPPWR